MSVAAGGAMAAGSIVGGIIGAKAQKKAQEAAMAMARQAAEQYGGIIPPEVKALIVEQLKSQGLYVPETEQAIDAGETAFAQMTENPELIAAQQAALQQMIGVSRTGLQASDRAALNKVRNEGQRDIEGKNQQILQQMQARGMGGSGAELAMQIANSQSGADRAAEESDRLAAQAQQNALRAIGASSEMASQGRGDDHRMASSKAQAADEMNRFNVSNQRSVAQRNVEGRNRAQAANLDEQQRIYETNVANNRAEQLRQEDAKQTRFKNQMDKASGIANALNGVVKVTQASGDRAANSAQSMWSGIGQLGGSIAKGVAASGPNNNIDPNTGMDRAGGSTGYSGDYLNMAHGGVVPGTAQVPGDSEVNDTVPAKLSPGEVVVPRSVASEPSKVPGFIKKSKAASEPKAEKASKGPSDEDLADHVIKSNALLHSLMTRIHKKGE